MGEIVVKQAARQGFGAGGRRALPHSHGHHTRCQQKNIATFDRGGVRLVGPPDTQEPRMVGIDQIGQRCLANPGG